MGKIITGEEFVNLVMDCYEGFNTEPDRNSIAEALSSYLSISCEDSNRCSAYGSTTPHEQEIDLYSFWEWICGTGMDIIGSPNLTFQLTSSSQYANNKLIDSTHIPVLKNYMKCAYIPLSDSTTFNDYTGADISDKPTLTSLDFYIYTGGLWMHFATAGFVNDGDTISVDDYNDFVFGGAAYFLDDDKTYNFRVDFGFETTDAAVCSRIDSLNVALDGPNGNTGVSTVFNESPDDGMYGYSFSVSGNTTLGDFKNLSAICIYGGWVGDSGNSDYYSDLYLTSMYIGTSASYNYMYITGATTGSTLNKGSVYLVPAANLQQNTAISIYVDSYDLSQHEITLRTPSSSIGISGNYLLPLFFTYGTVIYKLYIPITIYASGQIVPSSSEVYFDLNYSKGLYFWNNTTSSEVTYRPLTSSGLPSLSLSAGNNGLASPSYNLINKMHIYSSNKAVSVNVGASTTEGGMMSYTVASSISNSVISIIPPNHDFDYFLSHIIGGSGVYNVYFN